MHSDTPTDIEARAAQWLAQRDGTQWAAADAQALEAWLTDTRHRVAFLRLQASWQQAERAALEAVFGPHRHLDEGGYEIGLPLRR